MDRSKLPLRATCHAMHTNVNKIQNPESEITLYIFQAKWEILQTYFSFAKLICGTTSSAMYILRSSQSICIWFCCTAISKTKVLSEVKTAEAIVLLFKDANSCVRINFTKLNSV